MARIKWEFQQDSGHWLGKLGARIAFVVKPGADNQSWDILFNWTDVTYDGFPNIASTRDPCERKLVLFAEQTGITLPEDIEEDETLAEELMHRIQGEVRWFKDGDTAKERAHCVAVQVLDFFADWVKEHRKLVDSVGDDIEYRAAQSKLAEMEELLLSAQEDLGVEVERD
jgi:hypothetical protein